MRGLATALIIATALAGALPHSALAQGRRVSTADPVVTVKKSASAAILSPAASIANLSGTWIYRSYRNRPDVLVGDAADAAKAALDLLFGEGVMTLTVDAAGNVAGNFDMGGGMVLDLAGTATLVGAFPLIRVAGVGRPSTATDGWEYDYVGTLADNWPAGIDQIPAITGTVIRAKPHGSARAGYVASFIAVRQK